jgi:GNAT superfamily N-acetyltransferase
MIAPVWRERPILQRVPRGEHQDPRLVGAVDLPVAGVEPAAHLAPVHVGQVEVEAHDVVRTDRHLLHGIAPGQGDVHGIAVAPDALGQGVGQVFFVLDHQHSHGVPLEPEDRIVTRVNLP